MGVVDGLANWWLERLRLRQGLTPHRGDDGLRWESAIGQRCFLHVGCGGSHKQDTVLGFRGEDWREIRLDMDAAVAPDIVASMTDMADVPDGAVDAIFSSHNIEHLYPHEVPLALAEFYRVLKPDGFLVLTCPDLQSLCRLVADDKLDEPAYITPGGQLIAPLDVLYGLRTSLAAGNLFMAHHCGFTKRTLMAAARDAGFRIGHSLQRPAAFDLWLLTFKNEVSMDQLMRQVRSFLPVQD